MNFRQKSLNSKKWLVTQEKTTELDSGSLQSEICFKEDGIPWNYDNYKW